jgi:Domain of unknown function (DUF6378)
MNRESIRDILDVRRKTHGDFEEQANLWHDLFETCMATLNWYELTADQQHALVFILTKIARLLVGNHNEPDHWRDIAGYATLVADRLGPKPNSVRTEVTKDVTTYVHMKDEPLVPHVVPHSTMVPKALDNLNVPPWIIPWNDSIHDELRDKEPWYRSIGNSYYALESWVAQKGVGEEEPPPELKGYYTFQFFPDTEGWLLEIQNCPQYARDFWPRYRGHVNAIEHKEMLSWERGLYVWIESNSHFGLKPQHQAWSTEG